MGVLGGVRSLALLALLAGSVCACTTRQRDFAGEGGGEDASSDSGAGGHRADGGGAAGRPPTGDTSHPTSGRAGGDSGGPGGGDASVAPDSAASGSGGTTDNATGGAGSAPDAGTPPDEPDAAATLSDGSLCKTDADCTHSHCIDGVCCATTCSGCNACSNALTGKENGICAPVVSGKDPHDFCSDETATSPCGNDGTCDGKGACRKVGTSHECSPASCSADGKSYTPSANCDGNGKCVPATAQDCAGAQCTIANGCVTSCTSSSQCRNGFYCDTVAETCVTQKKTGTPATTPSECISGVISDGVCCDKQCTGCSACTLALNGQGGSATDGQCLPVMPGKPAPHGACTSSSTATCGQDGTCDGAEGCHYPTMGTTCAPPSCSGSTLTTSACDSSHNCSPKASPCAGSLMCNQARTDCLGSCTKDGDCASGYCVSGACAPTRKVGDSCSGPAECPNGYCVDGYCCNAKCDGDCQSCSQSSPGHCTTLTTPRTSCTGTGTCGKKYCDGTHPSCVYPGSETACPNQCSADWTAVVSSTCDGAGSCGGAKATNCSSSQYCSTSSNQCTTKISNTATACTKDIQCSTGKCCSTCVNPNNDNNHCGGCGNKCAPNSSCKSGTCACTGYTFPAVCGSTCGSWSFESGTSATENWTTMLSPQFSSLGNGALNIAISSNRPSGYPGTGTYSLVVPVRVDTYNSSGASVGVQFCQAGKTTSLGGYKVSGYVYFSGPTFPEYAVFAADTWGPNASEAAANVILLNNLVPNKWIPFELSMVFGFQYDHVAFRLGPNGAWSGTMYLDDISFTGL